MKLEELCAAVQEARYYNERFTRREYTSAFRTYTERFGPLYMEAVRETAEDPDGRRVLAEQLLDLLEAGWKRQRPWNRTMVQAREKQMLVTYLSPMLLGLEEPLCQELAERLRDGWNTRRPKDIYNITTSARLQEGFRNVILGEERVIVSNVAGTTRDAIDSYFENDQGRFVFIDTAGIRRKSKVEEDIEKYSVLRATLAIERSDVCLILIDATEGVTEQDTKVAGLAHEAGKASIIVVNKWDLIEKDGKTMDKMREEVRNGLAFMTYAPILFISAKTGQRVDRLFELIDYVSNQASTRITTGMLNSVLADAQTRVQPPSDKGRRLKIYYMTQVGIRPPHFVVFCNDSRLFHFSYQRYLENCLRNTFGLEGTPITLSIRQRGE